MTQRDRQDRTTQDREKHGRESQDDKGLAQTYRHAASGDAHHERESGELRPGAPDPTLTVTHEVPGVPMKDVARPDKADGENHAAPPSDKGPEHDALMRGLEPGETSAN